MSVIRFPKANTWFQNYTDTDLLPAAQNIQTKLLAAIADFPTPPVLPAALQLLIDAYAAALALATGPGAGKINTANKNKTKLALQNALRQDCQYVNQIISSMIATGTTYEAAQVLIESTGYQLSADPVPAGPLGPVVVRKYGSFERRQFYILAEPMRGAKGFVVRAVNLDAGTSQDYSFPSTRMTIPDLISGKMYTFMIAGVGANPTRNFGTTITDQVII